MVASAVKLTGRGVVLVAGDYHRRKALILDGTQTATNEALFQVQ